MKRILLMIIRNFFKAPYWFIKICIYGRNEKYSQEQIYALLKHVVIHANKAGRVIIEEKGLENLPKESGYIMFPNHQGLYDVLAFFETHPIPFTVVVKKEVAKVIFLKQILHAMKAQSIVRDDVRQSIKVINQMSQDVREGINYIIFPEGTRSKNNSLLDFKAGSFKSAMQAKCPIVPVALIDSYKAFDTNSIKMQTVQIHYLPPLYYEEYSHMKSTEIAKEVKQRIKGEIDQYAE